MVSILKGAVVFLADLMRHIDIPLTVDFMAVSSYRSTKSSGIVRLIMDLRESPETQNILIVEDIIDTGLTMKYLCENLKTRKLKSLKVCSFLYKPSRQQVGPDLKIDYLGFEIPDKFVVGYGMDYNEKYRNLPCVGVLKPEIYRRK
jgi:hypoxanthine phosphoribosyltransferase